MIGSSSIEVARKKRRAKTDGLDAKSLFRLLLRYVGGEEKVWSDVRVPASQQEDGRHLHREIKRLKMEGWACPSVDSTFLMSEVHPAVLGQREHVFCEKLPAVGRG